MEQIIKETDEKIKRHLPTNNTLEKIPKIIEGICRSEGIEIQKLRSVSRRGKLPKFGKNIAMRLIIKWDYISGDRSAIGTNDVGRIEDDEQE